MYAADAASDAAQTLSPHKQTISQFWQRVYELIPDSRLVIPDYLKRRQIKRWNPLQTALQFYANKQLFIAPNTLYIHTIQTKYDSNIIL